MPQPLTQADFDALAAYRDAGDAPGYYSYLGDRGYSYGTFAHEVVTGSSMSGRYGQAYAREWARNLNVPFTDDTFNGIVQGLMERDHQVRLEQWQETPDNAVLPHTKVTEIHNDVYAVFNLPIHAWGAYALLEAAGENAAAM